MLSAFAVIRVIWPLSWQNYITPFTLFIIRKENANYLLRNSWRSTCTCICTCTCIIIWLQIIFFKQYDYTLITHCKTDNLFLSVNDMKHNMFRDLVLEKLVEQIQSTLFLVFALKNITMKKLLLIKWYRKLLLAISPLKIKASV